MNASATTLYIAAAAFFVGFLLGLFALVRLIRAFVVLVRTRSESQSATILFKQQPISEPLSVQSADGDNSVE
jgi:hypothetical protein